MNWALVELSPEFEALYSGMGWPSIAPQKMLRALLLRAFYTVRSERQLMEQMDYNLLFRWFVGLAVDDAVWDATTFTKNRDRLLAGDIAGKFLAAVVDWFSRRVLAWRLSITMEAMFCVEVLEDALARYGRPEMFNTDQGSQFTRAAFVGALPERASRSAWTARAPGATTCSSSGRGGRSNTRRSICAPTRW